MYRLAIAHTSHKLMSRGFNELEDAVRAMIEVDRSSIFTIIELKDEETGKWNKVPFAEYFGLKQRIKDRG